MRHARPDYNRIQDLSGQIPVDEPVFLLRGQDKLAADTVRFWAFAAERKGLDPKMIHMARVHAAAMASWGKKLPDLQNFAEQAAEPQEVKVADSPMEGRVQADKDTVQGVYGLLRRLYVDSVRAEFEFEKKRQALRAQDGDRTGIDLAEQLLVDDVEHHTRKLEAYRAEKALRRTLDLLMPGWFDVDAGGFIPEKYNLKFISSDPDEHLVYLVLYGAAQEDAESLVQEAMRNRDAR